MSETPLIFCATCKKRPATCIGQYEGMETPEPACDECCGHGCEDGRCRPVAVALKKLGIDFEAMQAEAAAKDARIAALEARIKALCDHYSEKQRQLHENANAWENDGDAAAAKWARKVARRWTRRYAATRHLLAGSTSALDAALQRARDEERARIVARIRGSAPTIAAYAKDETAALELLARIIETTVTS